MRMGDWKIGDLMGEYSTAVELLLLLFIVGLSLVSENIKEMGVSLEKRGKVLPPESNLCGDIFLEKRLWQAVLILTEMVMT